ncbi:hypothetical protein DKY63_06365 [Pseudomonas putida]|uniref:Uncharacterized protein n=1 Tax=Pseudomonas putida TaxID=303 RepID=A0A2Z4RF06_PSEPU|nr:hypothetical protein [Pseudomonas putida]AWY39547.1 hypothetical protein DKY63_06365 [Pseudomonas putida]
MFGNNYRLTIQQCIPITASNQAHLEPVIEKKNSNAFTPMDQVRGQSVSSIEKMTQPFAQPDDMDYLSPYMIDLLGKTTTLSFAEKALQTPRKQLLDRLGIDDSQEKQRKGRLSADQVNVSRFYIHPVNQQPVPLTLNGSPFLEQDPTTPYFSAQKIITPDLRIHRQNENTHLLDLLRCKSRDDSEIFFDTAPIERLKNYNHTVFQNESQRHENGPSNKTDYFIEMTEYLEQKAEPGDFIVQNSLESSSDKHTPHFQFIPNQVSLPIFCHAPEYDPELELQIADWHLPAVYQRVDLQQFDWREKITQLQAQCKKLIDDYHISTTPFFRMLENKQLEAYLVFKKDGSPEWNMTPEDAQHTPGWLEAGGIFIANTPKAEVFNLKGAQEYYAAYSVPAERINELL